MRTDTCQVPVQSSDTGRLLMVAIVAASSFDSAALIVIRGEMVPNVRRGSRHSTDSIVVQVI